MDSLFTKEQKKKVHKKRLGIIVGVALCLALLPVTVFAEGGLKNTGGGDQLLAEEYSLTEQSLTRVNEEQTGGSSTQPSDTSTQLDNKTSQDQSSTQDSNTSSTQTDEDSLISSDSSTSEEDTSLSEQDLTDPDGIHEEGLIVAAASDTQTDTSVAKVEANGSTTFYDTVEEAFAAANVAGSATITLLKDCTAPASSTLTASGSDITLDLAGHTLTGNGQTSVITVAANTTFTLNDSTGTNQGTITGGKGSNLGAAPSYLAAGGGIRVFSGATFTMKGGTISGNIGINGGGVYIWSRASFTMKGGIISENIGVSRGGGVCAIDGNFTMDGGTISKNSTSIDSIDAVVSGEGGGVYIDGQGSFILNEGTISENTSIYGGGVSDGIDYSTRITINGGTISDNTAVCGGGIHARYLTINGGKISGNRARQIQGVAYDSAGGGIDALNLCLNGGIVSNNTAEQRAGGVNVAVPTTNIFFEATFTMTGGIITGNTAGQYGGGVCNQSIFNMEGGTITGNHAGKVGGGIFNEETGSNLVITTLALSGSPVVSGNTAGESENGAGDNVVLTRNAHSLPLALITLGELTDGAKVGLSVYDRDYPGYSYITPTFTSPVQFTRAETDTSYYADSSQYFFSDNPNYGVRINSDDKYLELAPALNVTLNAAGGEFDDGTDTASKTVVYGATYGELPTPTKSGFHFAAWSLSESDTGEHLHVGEDSEVAEKQIILSMPTGKKKKYLR